jgi:hypothetical protein
MHIVGTIKDIGESEYKEEKGEKCNTEVAKQVIIADNFDSHKHVCVCVCVFHADIVVVLTSPRREASKSLCPTAPK